MRFRSLIVALATFAIVTSAAAIAGCSKDKSTNPTTTTPESFDSGTLTSAPFTHPFPNKGTYTYRCRFHFQMIPPMVGEVDVDPSFVNTSASVTVSSNVFSPATVQVKPGSIVTWTLSGTGTHTVTRP